LRIAELVNSCQQGLIPFPQPARGIAIAEAGSLGAEMKPDRSSREGCPGWFKRAWLTTGCSL